MNTRMRNQPALPAAFTARLKRFGRGFVIAGVVQYAISSTILVVASIYGENLPMWTKITDVGLVVTLVMTAFFIRGAASGGNENESRRVSYAVATYLPVVLFLLMWQVSDRLIWNTLLPGLAWRTWLFLYSLPTAITAWRMAKG